MLAVEGRGLYWGTEPANFTSQPDGSIEISYDGPGWNDPDGTFDPLLWSYDVTDEPSSMPLRLHGVVGADRSTASVQLFADGQTHELKDGPPITGADAAMIEIAELVEAKDWRSLYLRIHERSRAFYEAEFVSEMTDGMAAYGEIRSATVTSPARVGDTGLGWDAASAGLELTFLKDGRAETYRVNVTLVTDGDSWWLAGISPIAEPAADGPRASAPVTPRPT